MMQIMDGSSGNPHNRRMKPLSLIMMMTFPLFLAMAAQPEAACNECHSKNPKMRKMHEALGYKDCFKCHGFGKIKKSPEERSLQMVTDPLCMDCHKK